MASTFDRWEKDPFFSAAEEVQESADRMESTYRTWIHAKKDASSMWNSEELCRDLRTAVGTTKWQLEEFARAVRSSYVSSSIDDARDRHHEFIIAIEDQISKIETSLHESTQSEGRASLPWVRLDEGECNELALFLSGPSASEDKTTVKNSRSSASEDKTTVKNLRSSASEDKTTVKNSRSSASEDKTTVKNHGRDNDIPLETDKESTPGCSKNSLNSAEWGSMEAKEEKSHGHRRTASASADIGAWKIAVADDGYLQGSSDGQPPKPPRKIPSFSGFLSSMESASKLKWPKNGFKKWKVMDRQLEADTALLQSPQLTKGFNVCYERSKSCLDSCDDCYDKQLYGWYGAIQRQLQRSQYQMQYSRPVQVILWIFLLLCLIVLIALRAI